MKTYGDFLNEAVNGYAERDITGLHSAKPGDFIEIGFEGTRHKQNARIDKIVSNNRLQDTEGNIFNRNGQIFRKKGSWVKQSGDKIVSARQITLKEYRERIIEFTAKILKEYNWAKLDISKIKQVGEIINYSFTQLNEL